MFRTAHPKDVTGLLRFAAQAAPNFAYPRHRLGTVERRVWGSRALLSTAVPRRGMVHTLLLTQGTQVGGLVSMRGHKRLSTWEIEQLLVSRGSEDACLELLARLDALVVQARGLRVFLRLAEDSPVCQAAAEAGYRRYLTEDLYSRPGKQSDTDQTAPLEAWADIQARPQRPEDDYPLFRLYTATTPVAVRAAEGLTFREWQETNTVRWQGTHRVRDTVLAREHKPVGWVRTAVAPSGRLVMSILAEARDSSALEATVKAALRATHGRRTSALVPGHATSLAERLEEAGFSRTGTYVSMVHQVGERVLEGAFMPAGV
jgi:hypothetical protein